MSRIQGITGMSPANWRADRERETMPSTFTWPDCSESDHQPLYSVSLAQNGKSVSSTVSSTIKGLALTGFAAGSPKTGSLLRVLRRNAMAAAARARIARIVSGNAVMGFLGLFRLQACLPSFYRQRSMKSSRVSMFRAYKP